MTDMVLLQKARERMSLRKVLWFKCMEKTTPILHTKNPTTYDAYVKALNTIAQAYAVSCQEVRILEEKLMERI